VGRADAALAQTERLAGLLPPDSPLPWIELGHSYELAHDYERALGAYDRASEVSPTSAEGPKRGGLRAARWGQLDLAEPRLAEATRRDAADAETWHALGVVRLGLGKHDAAREAYSAGLLAEPEALENRLGLATVALGTSRPAEALEQYDLIIAARPAHASAWLGRSWSLLLLGRLDEADASLREAEARRADAAVVEKQRAAISERRRQTAGAPPAP
jgi:tetratricopeptide (TPR) repeat protein